jgi:type IV pilus assembly protein PilN
MIRFNLLPQAKRQARAAAPGPSSGGDSQGWFIGYGVAVVGWLVMLGAIYFLYRDKLHEQELKNATLSQRIEQLKQRAGNLDDLKSKLDRSKQLENVVNQLQTARLGPARVLAEISRILSVGKGPTIDAERLEQMRRDNPLAGFNPSWDVRRLWLGAFQEENRECRMQGFGKTNEDVAEFLRRLALSELFENVTLQKTEATVEPETKLAVIGFELSCKVRY